MSVRRYLTLVFVCIVFLPLAVASYVVRGVVVSESSRRAEESLLPALDTAIGLYNERADAVDEGVRAAVSTAKFARLLRNGNQDTLTGYLQRRIVGIEPIDFLIALDEGSNPLAWAQKTPDFVPDVDTPSAEQILQEGETGMGFHRTRKIAVRLPGRDVLGYVIGGFWIDQDLLAVTARGETDLSVAQQGRVIASTLPLENGVEMDVSFGEPFESHLEEAVTARARRLGGRLEIIASRPTAPEDDLARRVLIGMVLLLLIALPVMSYLASKLAAKITEPLEVLSDGARAITQGDWSHRIPVEANNEVGRLAGSFNDMTATLEKTFTELRTSRDQLSESRDQLHRAIRRVGEVLRSRYDIKEVFDAIINTAADAIDSDAAILWTFTPTREELIPAVAVGIKMSELDRLKIGEGVAGFVGERGRTALIDGQARGQRTARGEPQLPIAMAVPLRSDDRIRGVIASYRAEGSAPFSEEDLETVIFLAEQGGVAMENVGLHEEAQRLSLTDGLTGTFNRRYFQMQFRQVLATAQRFERPFSVLMMDLDHFKLVNDNYGHQRGDALLIEFVQRTTRLLREVDTFARYGGEEFICLLAETDTEGAVTTAEKIREAIKAEGYGSLGEPPINLTVSIGVATYGEHGDNYNDLVEAADRALYRAKQGGRDRVAVAGEGPSSLKIAT
ncbi:MAG: diguanylate cyclase [Actinobacteria bacterium]|nr:diguanylate cyclase [Actinomycetota bacterium]